VVRRLVVGKKDAYAVLQQEATQDALVLGLPPAMREARTELGDDDERQDDEGGVQSPLGLGQPA
jgi:hypothetical protein